MSEPVALLSSRWKSALIVLGGLAFVAIGLWLIQDPDGARRYSAGYMHLVGYACVLFFGAAAVVGLGMIFKPSRLVLDPAGLTYAWLWGEKTWAWRDVGPFELDGAGQSGRMIRFDVGGEAGRPTGFSSAMARRPSIPGGWTRSISDVCAELNAARERWR